MDLKKLATYFLSKIWKQSLGNLKEEIKHAFTERIELGIQKTHLSLQFWAFSEDRVFRQLKKGYLQQETLVKIEILEWDLDRWSQNKRCVDCRNQLSKWVVISNTFLSYPKKQDFDTKSKKTEFSNQTFPTCWTQCIAMLIVKIDTVHPIFENHDGHKSVLEAL